jgi:long-chain acyl-CoA synthetase
MASNLSDLVRVAAQRRPEAPALRSAIGGELDWSGLDAEVDAAAAGFRGLELHPGDRVALVLENSVTFVSAYFGALRAGLVAVPIHASYTSREVAALMGRTGAKAAVCGPSTEHVVDEAVATTRRVVITDGASYDALLASGRGAGPVQPRRRGEDMAVVLFTSGTSGRPRGAMLSHRALLANLDQALRIDPAPMLAGDVVLVALPLTHIYGLNAVLGLIVATGACAVLVDRFEPPGVLEVIRQARVTNLPAVPAMYAALMAEPGAGEALAGIRIFASGAAPLPADVARRTRALVGQDVHVGYGLTETAPILTTTLCSRTVKSGSIGRAVPGVDLRLVDESGARVEEGDPGEIEVRGPNLFSGYWPDAADGPRPDGWWRTGDIAYADADGDLFIVDRRRELILVNGFNVYPREIEDVIATAPGVAEVAVLGVADSVTGEAVQALVVAEPGSGLTPEAVLAHTATRLARFKQPAAVRIVDELPHSATGKVAKGRLRDGETFDHGGSPQL